MVFQVHLRQDGSFDVLYIEGTVLPQMNLEDHHTVNNKIFLCRIYVKYVNTVQWTELSEFPQPPNNKSPQLITRGDKRYKMPETPACSAQG